MFKRVIERKAVRAEATLQADIRQFLLEANLNLGEQDLLTPVLEAQVGGGTGHRIDIEMGATVIEVKKDISRPKIRKDSVLQLARYVRARTEQRERRHVGILTDGADWRAYTLVNNELNEVNHFDARERNTNFRKKLTDQLPGAPLRVVYAKAAMYVTAALVDDPNAIIDHKLYWGAVATRQEGMYLLAVLNSPYTTEVVRPLMSYGKDERDIDKAVWELPIPAFDPTDAKHRRIAEIGEAEHQRIAELKFEYGKSYIQLRRTLRDFLVSSLDAEELDQLVTEMLG